MFLLHICTIKVQMTYRYRMIRSGIDASSAANSRSHFSHARDVAVFVISLLGFVFVLSATVIWVDLAQLYHSAF